MEAGLIKRDLEDVNAPWKALSEDISHIYEIVKNDSFTDYEKMRDAFEEIEKEWTKLRNNLSSLNLDASVSKVVSVDNIVAEKDSLLSLAQKDGISMESYVFA